MNNVKLIFEFKNIKELQDFTTGLGQSLVESTTVTNVTHTDTSPNQQQGATKPDALASIPAPNAGLASPSTKGAVKGTEMKAALRAYKEVNGHPKYKELLAYFNAPTVRDIPKDEYANVVAMCQSGIPDAPAAVQTSSLIPDMGQPATTDTTQGTPVPGAAYESGDGLDETEEVTADQMRQALGAHKKRHGHEATLACINALGYATPNDIPQNTFGMVVSALENDVPTQDEAGVDLSDF